jgi:CheY-like chemotaxis protein/HPt (histidine-containing phosphotransfer) domain-containing protein
MNSVIGFSEVLAQEDLTEEQHRYVNLIWRSGKNLMRIINDILDFSKIEAGKLEMDMVECSISQTLADVDEMLRPMAQDGKLEFKILQSGQLPATICTDPERLHQCLVNLVSNAIKFTNKGYVYIKVAVENYGENVPYIRFDVEDSGIGIKIQDREKIFESFTQADGSTRRKYGGTGLGLAITGHLARLLGGELSVVSEEGKGSTFSLVIPVKHDSSQSVSSKIENNSRIDTSSVKEEKVEECQLSGHVLVAEDVETNQILAKALLGRMGLDVSVASDGHEAVQKAMSGEFDLIFMDIQMPGMDGFEATRELRRKGLKTPVIALTAHAMKGDDQKCFEAGCNDYLSKPLERVRLLEKVCRYLSGPNDVPDVKEESVTSEIDGQTEVCSDSMRQESDAGVAGKSRKPDNKEIMNWDRLISRLGDEELIREIVPIFLKDNEERIEKLVEAVNTCDAEAVKLYAHAIRGAGRNVGAQSLADVAYDLERASMVDNIETTAALLDTVRVELEKITAFLSKSDWIDIAKREKIITDDILNTMMTSE